MPRSSIIYELYLIKYDDAESFKRIIFNFRFCAKRGTTMFLFMYIDAFWTKIIFTGKEFHLVDNINNSYFSNFPIVFSCDSNSCKKITKNCKIGRNDISNELVFLIILLSIRMLTHLHTSLHFATFTTTIFNSNIELCKYYKFVCIKYFVKLSIPSLKF